MSWFKNWVDLYCQATGAIDGTRESLLANEQTITGHWQATVGELGEVTARLVADCRIPAFANKHLNAIGLELVDLRKERSRAAHPAPGHFAADCELCSGSGFVVVPHPRCVSQGKLFRDRATGQVLTVAVICDRAGCSAGALVESGERKRDTKKNDRRPTYTSYTRMIHGADGAKMLRDFERWDADDARRRHPRPPEWDGKVATLIRIIAGLAA